MWKIRNIKTTLQSVILRTMFNWVKLFFSFNWFFLKSHYVKEPTHTHTHLLTTVQRKSYCKSQILSLSDYFKQTKILKKIYINLKRPPSVLVFSTYEDHLNKPLFFFLKRGIKNVTDLGNIPGDTPHNYQVLLAFRTLWKATKEKELTSFTSVAGESNRTKGGMKRKKSDGTK